MCCLSVELLTGLIREIIVTHTLNLDLNFHKSAALEKFLRRDIWFVS